MIPTDCGAWDDCKLAFGFNGDEEIIWGVWDQGNLPLPYGWSLCETNGSGAQLVVIFRVEGVIPSPSDSTTVRALLDRMQTKAVR